jgi:tripartite-type tricarboxylate transporter receptor subunit TctC
MRSIVGALAFGIAAAAHFAGPAWSQQYPSQPIKIIVPTPAGGVADITGRALAQRLNDTGKTAVVENRTGAGGAIAAAFVAKSPADGHTVYVGFHATQAILPHLQTLTYDAEKDFAPVTVAVQSANIMVVNPKIPASSAQEFVAYAKANSGKVSYGSQGNGSSGHILGEQFKQLAGIDLAHVAYRGGAPAVQDLVAGHVAVVFDILTLARPQVEAGNVKALLITSAQPDPVFPGVPTAKQAGFPQLEGGPWFGFFVPTGTPKAVIDFLYEESKQAFGTPMAKEQMKQQLLTPILGTPDQTKVFVAAEYKRWGEIIKSANIKLQ